MDDSAQLDLDADMSCKSAHIKLTHALIAASTHALIAQPLMFMLD